MDKNQTKKWINEIRELIPSKSRPPLLLAPEPLGHEAVRFQSSPQSLRSWNSKRFQSWTLHGAVKTQSNRLIGFEFHFLEMNLRKDFIGVMPALWIKPHVTAVYFSLTDPHNASENEVFKTDSRGGVFSKNLGFADTESFHIEYDGWSLFQKDSNSFSFAAKDFHLDLQIMKPIVMHGQNGFVDTHYNQESSYVCSYSRLNASGRMILKEKLTTLKGNAWLEHEKMSGESFVQKLLNPENRNQLALQFDSGEEFYLEEGRYSTFIDGTGNSHHLVSDEVKSQVIEYWTSPQTGIRYPLKKRYSIPSLSIEFEIRPLFLAQEAMLRKNFLHNRWTGLVAASGQNRRQSFSGHGRLRITGIDLWLKQLSPLRKFDHNLTKYLSRL